MRTLRRWMARLLSWIDADRREQDFNRELESHLQMHVDDNRRLGMTEAEARRQALLKLGGVDQTRERHRDARGFPALETVIKDVRYAARMMRRNPGFSAVVLATLALGIGGNTLMFSVVETVLLRPLPYDEPEQIVSVRPLEGVQRSLAYASPPDFYALREQNQTLAGLDAFFVRALNLTGDHPPERFPALVVSSGFFSTLGVRAGTGRTFLREDEVWDNHRVVLITDGLWSQRFNRDPTIVGRGVVLNGQPYTVVGVLPPAFTFLDEEFSLVVPNSLRARRQPQFSQ